MKTFISALTIVLLFCQMEFKREKNTDFSVLRIDTPEVAKEEIVCSLTQYNAGFKGGDKQYIKFLKDNLVYPPSALRDSIQGTVYVRFMVDKDGVVVKDCVKIAKSVRADIDAEAIRLVKLTPNWESAQRDGKAIPQRIRVPVKFKIGR